MYFVIVTSVVVDQSGYTMKTRTELVRSGDRSAVRRRLLGPGAKPIFFYMEEERLERGSYAAVLTVQSPQGGGSFDIFSVECPSVPCLDSRAAALRMIYQQTGLAQQWPVLYFELRSNNM